jgi:hypothetical protein
MSSSKDPASTEDPNIASALLASRELDDAEPKRVKCTDSELQVELKDGRVISTPLKWYPRLVHATKRDRANVKVSRDGVHWPAVDEDLSVRGMLLGRKSGESRDSFRFWLKNYRNGRLVTISDFVAECRKRKKRTT